MNKIVMRKKIAKATGRVYAILLPAELEPLWEWLYNARKDVIITIEYDTD